MNIQAQEAAKAMVPHAPNAILNQLDGVINYLKDADQSEGALQAIRVLRKAAGDVRSLFELQTDPDTGQFLIRNYGHAWMLADLLYAAGTVPASYENAEQVVIGLMKATELKVSPITGLANIMIVNKRPSVWGDLAQALIERSGALEWQRKEEIGDRPEPGAELASWPLNYGWKVTSKRRGQEEPYVGTFTVADAKQANLWLNSKRQPWLTDPRGMLFNRARARCFRDGFADQLLGMGLIEEQTDFINVAAVEDPAAAAAVKDERKAALFAPEEE